MVFTAVCMGAVLAAPSGASALSTHFATTTTLNSNGQLVATATCGAGEHVVSGGFKSPLESAAVVSRAVKGNSWSVHLVPGNTDKLTTYAYCASTVEISAHESKMSAVAAPANTTATAMCGSGETLVSGGYAFLSTPSSQGNSPTFRDYAAITHQWTVMAAFTHIPAELAAFAYCSPGVVVKVRSASAAIAGSSTFAKASATASCHSGETLLAGGYTTRPTPDYNDQVGPDTFFNASYRSGTRSWTASAVNYSVASGKITAFAYCEP
jgi:hypothetical protein